ncbi:putative GATA transcription factor 22 [Syzygium oleosum]|uniref:putative GATA transcription factor 22 n=1 Tax=Syzygium oleosum TaxID=219896 RepID=UPI0024B9B03B|nr:putative GATA transcription factor 22 [Syzygium oleosum]
MNPVYLNPPQAPSFPLLERQEDQTLQFFISPHQEPPSSPSSSSMLCASFPSRTEDQSYGPCGRSETPAEKASSNGGSKHTRLFPSSSLLQPTVSKSETSDQGRQKSFSFNGENGEEVNRDFGIKWMPLKMRFMQKMKNKIYSNGSTEDESMQVVDESAKNHHRRDRTEIRFSSNGNNAIRVCADCNTTTTPLWRSGPRGPKSLCNACGIRQRKARRAMEEAAAAATTGGAVVATTDPTSVRMKGHNKEKKSRASHAGQICKKQSKQFANQADSSSHGEKKLFLGDFARGLSKSSAFLRAFPQDEAEAAILLMELSCGFVHG